MTAKEMKNENISDMIYATVTTKTDAKLHKEYIYIYKAVPDIVQLWKQTVNINIDGETTKPWINQVRST